jgi:hypothetical protein
MMIDTATLYRLAGWSAAVAIVTLIISGIALAIFFQIGEPWGSINDFFVVLTALALILPMLAVDRVAVDRAGWLRIVTIVAIGGAVLIAIGQSLLIARVIDLQASYLTGGIGLVPVLVWLVALVVLAFGSHALVPAIGWSALASLAMVVIFSLVAAATMGPAMWVASIVLLLAISAWLALLSADLLARVSA